MKNPKKHTGEASLNWKLKDYQNHKEEAPARINENPGDTEGELMSDEEIEDWFLESLEVLKILKEEDREVFLKVHKGFVLDLEYLLSLGRIDQEVVEQVKDLEIFKF